MIAQVSPGRKRSSRQAACTASAVPDRKGPDAVAIFPKSGEGGPEEDGAKFCWHFVVEHQEDERG